MRSTSWRVKLAALFALILVAVLLFQLFVIIPHIRNREVSLEQDQQEGIAYSIARELDTDLMQTRGRLVELTERPEFRNMDVAAMQKIMATIAEGSYRFESFSVLDTDGRFVASTVEGFSVHTGNKSYADRPYFLVPFKQGETYFAPPRFHRQAKLVSVSVSVPIESETGKRVGVLMGGFRLNHLIATVADYPLEEGQVVCVVDKAGTVVAHSGKDLFALEAGPLSLDYGGRPMVQAVMAGRKGKPQKYEQDGRSYFGTCVILESNGWGVVVRAPMSVILATTTGLTRWMLLVSVLLFVVTLALTLFFTRQITETQRRAEKALRESEGKLNSMLQSIGDHMSMMDKDLNILWANEIARRIFGNDIVGKKCYEAYHGRQKPCEPYPCITLKAFEDGKVHEHDTQVTDKDGKTIHFHCTANVALRDEEGKPAAVLEISRNITERKQAEEELVRFSSAVKMTTDSVVVSDLNGRIIDVNEATLRMFGTDNKDDLIGKNSIDLIAPEDRRKAVEDGKIVLEKGYVRNREYNVITKDGGRIPVEMSVAVMTGPDGKPTGFVGINRDITERKRAEEELKKHRERLEELVEERTQELKQAQDALVTREKLATLGQVAGSVAHEIRNPLGSIRNAVYFLKMTSARKLEGKPARHLEIIDQEIERTNKIITSLLSFVRGPSPEPGPCQLKDILVDAIDKAALQRGVEVKLGIPDGMPDLNVDCSQMTQVFLNLLANAAQAMDNKGTIVVTAELTDGKVRVTVTDTGSGIPADHMNRLFEPLFSTKAFGVGLGLPICKSFVEANHGTIAIDSESGKGTAVTVTLPIAQISRNAV